MFQLKYKSLKKSGVFGAHPTNTKILDFNYLSCFLCFSNYLTLKASQLKSCLFYIN